MTIDEEIENLKYDIEGNLADLDFEFAEDNRQIIAWLEELKELREKQIPKEISVLLEHEGYFDWECPKCNMTYGMCIFKPQYCPMCGQKLDWR